MLASIKKGAKHTEGFIEEDEFVTRFEDVAKESLICGKVPIFHPSGTSVTVDGIVGSVLKPRDWL